MPHSRVVHPESEMVAPYPGDLRLNVVATDEVQFLGDAELKPRPRKIKRRPGDLLEPQHFAVKSTASFDVAHEKGHMVQFKNSHGVCVPICQMPTDDSQCGRTVYCRQ